MLAAGAVGDVTPALEIAAGILGGGVAATSHATKAGTRLLINTSPEPVTNWTASISEDILVIAGLWTALTYPIVFLALFVIFILLAIWLLPKLWFLIKAVLLKIARFLGIANKELATSSGDGMHGTATENDANFSGIAQQQQLEKNGVQDEADNHELKKQIPDKRDK